MNNWPLLAQELWDQVPGQVEPVRRLQASADSPSHAYLILGPEGSGKRALATAFAAELLARSADSSASATVRRVAAEDHPGLIVVEREGPFITAADARSVVERASRSPLEGALQVILMVDFHLVRDAGPMLLKSIEEPPATTMFVLLAEDLPSELDTIGSRCVTITLDALSVQTLVAALEAEGCEPSVARIAAENSGGSLSRARLLARDPTVTARRDLWYSVPDRLNGRGARASELVDEILGSIADLKAPLAELETEELDELQARAEAMGTEVRKGEITRVREKHKRSARRMQSDEIRLGLGVVVSRYRDDMSSGGDPEVFLAAADRVQRMCDDLVFNVTDSLALLSLFMELPPLSGDGH